eukprot:scaffold171174_cov21-Tisochrysis_lutea.AAC.1
MKWGKSAILKEPYEADAEEPFVQQHGPRFCSKRTPTCHPLCPLSFAEVCPDEEYNVNFPRLCDRVGRSKLPEDARCGSSDLTSIVAGALLGSSSEASIVSGDLTSQL